MSDGLTLADLTVRMPPGQWDRRATLADLVAVDVAEGGEFVESMQMADTRYPDAHYPAVVTSEPGRYLVFRIPEDTSDYQGADHE